MALLASLFKGPSADTAEGRWPQAQRTSPWLYCKRGKTRGHLSNRQASQSSGAQTSLSPSIPPWKWATCLALFKGFGTSHQLCPRSPHIVANGSVPLSWVQMVVTAQTHAVSHAVIPKRSSCDNKCFYPSHISSKSDWTFWVTVIPFWFSRVKFRPRWLLRGQALEELLLCGLPWKDPVPLPAGCATRNRQGGSKAAFS